MYAAASTPALSLLPSPTDCATGSWHDDEDDEVRCRPVTLTFDGGPSVFAGLASLNADDVRPKSTVR